MGVFERIKSAVAGAIPVEDDLDMGSSQRVKNLPAPADPNDAATQSEVGTQVENHRTGETHTTGQPPQSHGNSAHTSTFAVDGDAQPPESHGNAAHDDDYLTDAPVDSVNGATGAVQTFYRQSTKPTGAIDGATWVTNSDGSGNDTTSRYVYNADADRWELDSAVGPSEPNAGTPVAGAQWQDTSSGTVKLFDGTAFKSITPSSIVSTRVEETITEDTTKTYSPGGEVQKIFWDVPFSTDITNQTWTDLDTGTTVSPPNVLDSNPDYQYVIEQFGYRVPNLQIEATYSFNGGSNDSAVEFYSL